MSAKETLHDTFQLDDVWTNRLTLFEASKVLSSLEDLRAGHEENYGQGEFFKDSFCKRVATDLTIKTLTHRGVPSGTAA